MDLTRALIRFDEAERSKPYQDDLGIWTVADGHNLEANGLPRSVAISIYARLNQPVPDGLDPVPFPECLDLIVSAGGLSEQEIDALYAIDLEANCGWLTTKTWWAAAGEARQAALNDMSFNLGPKKAQGFTGFFGFIDGGDWNGAADDLLNNTAVAKQLPKRYGRLAQILRTGSAAGIIPGVPA